MTGKIAELCKYIKDNLGNTLRCILDTMLSNRRTWNKYNTINASFNNINIQDSKIFGILPSSTENLHFSNYFVNKVAYSVE